MIFVKSLSRSFEVVRNDSKNERKISIGRECSSIVQENGIASSARKIVRSDKKLMMARPGAHSTIGQYGE
jgi:hypothetical protein